MSAMRDYLGVPAAALRSHDHISIADGKVYVEGEEVARYRTAEDGILLWAVAHTVVAVNPPRGASAMLHFIQRSCLNVKEEQTSACRNRGMKLAAFIGL